MKKFGMWLLAAACSCVLASPAVADKPDKPKKSREEIFKKLDKNSDGALTFEEFKGKREGDAADKAEKRFKRLDQDGNGQVSLEEFTAPPKKKDK